MGQSIKLELRRRILKVYDKGGTTQEQCAERFGVSYGFVKKLISQRRHTGDIAPKKPPGPKPKITPAHRAELRELIDRQPDLTLEQLRDAIEVDCTIQAVFYVLKSMGISYKKRLSTRPSNTAPTSSSSGSAGR